MLEPDQITRIQALKPIDDAAAAALAAPETHAELRQAIVAQPSARTAPRPRRWTSRWNQSPLVPATALAAIIAILLVATPGLLSGGNSATQPQSAQAEILHRITTALARRPGTIVLQVERVHMIPGGTTRRETTFTDRSITETSSHGQEQRTLMIQSGQRGFQLAGDGDLMEIYDPVRGIIYETTVRAWQAATRGNLPYSKAVDTTVDYSPVPARLSVPEQELRQHLYRIAGGTTIDGRRVLRLLPRHLPGVGPLPIVYLSRRTYAPVREVQPRRATGGSTIVTDWLRYAVLPATRTNERLVSLSALHPHAHLVHGARAYIAAQRRANSR